MWRRCCNWSNARKTMWRSKQWRPAARSTISRCVCKCGPMASRIAPRWNNPAGNRLRTSLPLQSRRLAASSRLGVAASPSRMAPCWRWTARLFGGSAAPPLRPAGNATVQAKGIQAGPYPGANRIGGARHPGHYPARRCIRRGAPCTEGAHHYGAGEGSASANAAASQHTVSRTDACAGQAGAKESATGFASVKSGNSPAVTGPAAENALKLNSFNINQLDLDSFSNSRCSPDQAVELDPEIVRVQ